MTFKSVPVMPTIFSLEDSLESVVVYDKTANTYREMVVVPSQIPFPSAEFVYFYELNNYYTQEQGEAILAQEQADYMASLPKVPFIPDEEDCCFLEEHF